MLGWSITIFDLTPEGCREFYRHGGPETAVLARWQVSLGGLFWLERRIDRGKAMYVDGSSFPSRYRIQARQVQALRLLEDVRPQASLARPVPGAGEASGISQGSGWINRMEVYPERLARCDADSMLTVDAWDLM